MFGYGFLAVVLVLYLAAAGLDPLAIGVVLTLTLIGDTIISLWLTTNADRFGRRRTLVAGAALMVVAGIAFALTSWVPLLILAGAIGVISPTGNEVGPFLAVEQAAPEPDRPGLPPDRDLRLVQPRRLRRDRDRRARCRPAQPGAARRRRRAARRLPGDRHRLRADRRWSWSSASGGSARRSRRRRARRAPTGSGAGSGSGARRRSSSKLSVLFSLDAFGGGFIPQSLMAYWFHLQYGVDPATLGAIFFAANLLAAVSSLLAARIAARIGLINTMVFTHLPSNVLLILVPLMPNLQLAVAVLLLRFTLSQMDVPTRQSYVMAVVDPDERSAAAGVTGVARTTGAALSPSISSVLIASVGYAALPFYLAGGFKIAVRPADVPRLPQRQAARGGTARRSREPPGAA